MNFTATGPRPPEIQAALAAILALRKHNRAVSTVVVSPAQEAETLRLAARIVEQAQRGAA